MSSPADESLLNVRRFIGERYCRTLWYEYSPSSASHVVHIITNRARLLNAARASVCAVVPPPNVQTKIYIVIIRRLMDDIIRADRFYMLRKPSIIFQTMDSRFNDNVTHYKLQHTCGYIGTTP